MRNAKEIMANLVQVEEELKATMTEEQKQLLFRHTELVYELCDAEAKGDNEDD